MKTAMLAIQRYPWEQGVCAQAMYEAGEVNVFVAMAHDAVLRQEQDGRLATITRNIAVTDPAANGEAVLRAYECTGDKFYKTAADKMLGYLMEKAPRTTDGLICHNDISFDDNFSPMQIWVDSCYMAPPFLAVMEEFSEAEKQLDGYIDCLKDNATGLLFHIFDKGTNRFVRKKLWATGNGWALMGIARVICEARNKSNRRLCQKYEKTAVELLDSILKYQHETGMFHDILDDETTFLDGTSAMMTAAVIYRGVYEGWLNHGYLKNADSVYEYILQKIDEFGIIRGVCGCPHFMSEGTSAEAQAAYIMMHAWRKRLQ
ncbi:MAG: glycoside hydrolase family 88 protein [Oscillospiraceae bacterium]|nr:glycoside hydrolase family 88 protein [Oscillospiraceae bacterium]